MTCAPTESRIVPARAAQVIGSSAWLGSDFRVVWKREGLKQKTKAYKTLKGAQRFAGILGPNPWEHLGIDPDKRICCSGYECGCEGATYRSRHEETRANMPALEWVRIEQRPIGPWSALPNQVNSPTSET